MADGEEPVSSSDENSYFDWLPKRGTSEWAEYAFPQAATVSEAQVYWFQHGRTKVPASWRILYKDGNDWKPVQAAGPYGVDENKYNVVRFQPVKTSALRLEFQMQPQYSAGIEEWKVK
jgi:hypothetical protein